MRLVAAILGIGLVLGSTPVRAEAVYEFVKHCREERLGDCFSLINARLNRLNEGRERRICLPRAFGGIVLDGGVIPVSVLEHVRVKLSAARFGRAGAETDDVMVGIVNAIYPCNSDRAGLR